MPELAEVEFYRKQWNPGLGRKILAVELHGQARVLRDTDARLLSKSLSKATLLRSETHGKRMLFRFSNDGWLGLHLGMTGQLRVEPKGFAPARHDHLILRTARLCLVFSDPRQFGRIQFHAGRGEPSWWCDRPPGLLSRQFTLERMRDFLRRHGKAPIKAVLLNQDGFPGLGNWMVDEVLWRARLAPPTRAGRIKAPAVNRLYRAIQWVSREALRIIGKDFSDPPRSWLLLHRWKKGNHCPRCGAALRFSEVGGRTTCYCQDCQGATSTG